MNEAYEVELSNITASFIASPFNLMLGVERQTTLVVDESENVSGFTDVEWQVIYARAQIDGQWYFLPQDQYDQIDGAYSDLIGDKLWELTQKL